LDLRVLAVAAAKASASLDKSSYLAGQTGYVSVTVYNDKSDIIRITELSVTVDYYYADGTVYIQKFFTNATLPSEIQVGQSKTCQIPVSLPTNIAAGYTDPSVEAKTELWYSQIQRWTSSDRATYHLKLYVESPYKQTYETTQATANMLAVATIVFASVAAFGLFLLFTRKPRPLA
jgi:sporulation-control protein spo0M